MRPKRRHDRFGAMRIAPAVGPLSIKIVRMVGDTRHLARLMQLFDEFAHGWAGFG